MHVAHENIDRIGPTRRPAQPVAGYHKWWDLLFIHWRVPADVLRPLLPKRLTIDTFQGSAWVGLVPFRMTGVRPWWSPPLPGVSAFAETNVRTYVHFEGRDPGVWFFSLDAASSLAVKVARRRWMLNYYRARMRVEREGTRVRYHSRRLWPGPAGAGGNVEAEIGPLIRPRSGELPPGSAEPGSLEHFLVERYILYAQGKDGRLYSGRVHHTPYPLREARLIKLEETLVAAAGIAIAHPPEHVLFSDGVSVEIFKLKGVA